MKAKLIALMALTLVVSCAKVSESRSSITQAQHQTITDVVAKSVAGAVAFKDITGARECLSTLSKSGAECAIIVGLDGGVIADYSKPSATLSPAALGASVQKTLPEPRSAYASDLKRFVTVSPVKTGEQTVAYVALAYR